MPPLRESVRAPPVSLLRDPRIHRVLGANAVSSIGSGVTMIAVPWLIVQRPGGAQAFGYATATVTLALVFLLPYYGWIVDRYSRKTVLLAGELFGLLATSGFLALALWRREFATWHLVGIFTTGTLYYTIHYPALFAFNQEVFASSQYRQLAGLVEVQGQTASVVAAGLAAFLIGRVDLNLILGFSTATYAASFWLLRPLPYARSPDRPHSNLTALGQINEGWRYLSERPGFALFLVCAFMPFVGIMVSNYLFPIYATRTLLAGPMIFGAGEVTFALGAIFAGLTVPRLSEAIGSYHTVLWTVAMAALATLSLALFPAVGLYLALNALLGWGNAGSRVARSTIILMVVPNALIGRVNVLFNLLERLLRTFILIYLTSRVEVHGAPFGFGLIAVLTGLAWIGVVLSRKSVPAND
jgi:MFS family permease